MSIQTGRTEIPRGFIDNRPVKFALAPVFTDSAVLQREKDFTVFGECPKGSVIEAFFVNSGETSRHSFRDDREYVYFKSEKKACSPISITVSEDEETRVKYNLPKGSARFEIVFPAQKAGEGFELTVSCISPENETERITLSDICFGEVFLAGGQSNMEFELQNSLGGMDELEKYRETYLKAKNEQGCNSESSCESSCAEIIYKLPNIRYFYTPKLTIFNEEREKAFANTGWNRFNPDTSRAWSAIGYYFAKELSEKLGCTVGIIGCNWGGTSATAWTDTKRLWEDSEFKTYFEDYIKGAEGLSDEAQKEAYDEYVAYQAEWDRKAAILYTEKPGTCWFDAIAICGENRYPGPKNSANPFRPGAMYESMLKPLSPYTLRGFLYYQGESDDHKPQMYQRLFTEMISNWRADWKDSNAWFLYVQLPMHRYLNDDDYKNWCVIREAQRRVNESDKVNNTAMAAALDCGAYNDIHPKEKRVVAHRLAMQAMEKIFGEEQQSDAPGIISAETVACEVKKEDFDREAGDVKRKEENKEACEKAYEKAYEEACKEDCEAMGEDEQEKLFKYTIKLSIKNSFGPLVKKLSVPYLDPRTGDELPVAGFEISEDGERYFGAAYKIEGDSITLSVGAETVPKYVRYAWTNYAAVEIFGANGLPLLPLAPMEIK